jgi:hypothetical protein
MMMMMMMMMMMKSSILWDVTPQGILKVNRRFVGTLEID